MEPVSEVDTVGEHYTCIVQNGSIYRYLLGDTCTDGLRRVLLLYIASRISSRNVGKIESSGRSKLRQRLLILLNRSVPCRSAHSVFGSLRKSASANAECGVKLRVRRRGRCIVVITVWSSVTGLLRCARRDFKFCCTLRCDMLVAHSQWRKNVQVADRQGVNPITPGGLLTAAPEMPTL